MDQEEANKFINSLVKNLQVLCHGHVNFRNSIQVIGHLYLNVDSDVNINYIVNEKVCKNDTSSTVFVSKSYHSEPHKADNKSPASEPSKNNQSPQSRLSEPLQRDYYHNRVQNLHSGENNSHKKSRKRSENAYLIHPPKVFKRSTSPVNVSPLHTSTAVSDSSTDELSSHLKHSDNGPIDTSSYHDDSEQTDKKPFQVIPPIIDVDVDFPKIKSEPVDHDADDSMNNCSFQDQMTASGQGASNVSCADQMEDMSSDEFLIGLRDKSLGLYPVAMHPNELSSSFGLAGHSSHSFSSQPLSSSLPTASSGDLVSCSSNNSASFYSPKNNPMSVRDGLKCRKNQCPYCGIYHTNVVQHIKEKHLSRREYCPTCLATFTRKTSLYRHLANSCKALPERGATKLDESF